MELRHLLWIHVFDSQGHWECRHSCRGVIRHREAESPGREHYNEAALWMAHEAEHHNF